MRIHVITALLILIAAIFFAGCSADPTGVVLNTDSIMGSVEDTIGGELSEVGEATLSTPRPPAYIYLTTR